MKNTTELSYCFLPVGRRQSGTEIRKVNSVKFANDNQMYLAESNVKVRLSFDANFSSRPSRGCLFDT